MKRFLLVLVCLFLVAGFVLGQCPCGKDCRCPAGACPDCCTKVMTTKYPTTRKAYCFSLFGSLIGLPARAIYVPVQTTDPALAAQLTVLQNQQATMAQQLAFDRQAQTMWQQQQAQLQVLQANNATLLQAINAGKADTDEAKQLMRQVIDGQHALILQLQQPLQVVPVPAAPAPMTPLPTTPPAATTPGLGAISAPNQTYKVYITRPMPWSPKR